MLSNIIDHRTNPHATQIDAGFEFDHRSTPTPPEFGVDYVTDTTVADATLWAQLRFLSPVVLHVYDVGTLKESDNVDG